MFARVVPVASVTVCSALRPQTSPDKHPIVIMRDIPYKDMAALLTFIYQGEVTVSEEELPSFLKTAKALEVRGLADDDRAKPPGGTAPPPAAAAAAAAARAVSWAFIHLFYCMTST